MKRMTDLEFLKLNKIQRTLYLILIFILNIPTKVLNLCKTIGNAVWTFLKAICSIIKMIVVTFVKGSWPTRVSYLIMGFGNFYNKQFLRGGLFFLFEVVFIAYMATSGFYWLGKFDNLGDEAGHKGYNEVLDVFGWVEGDDSFKILLYGIITIFFVIAFLYTWYWNIKQNKTIEEIKASGKKLKSSKDDLKSLLDDQFHTTMLALPVTGIAIFTVLPIIFMILVAFTNYDGTNNGRTNLFTWVGLDNFNEIVRADGTLGSLGFAFGEILTWTLIWAFFATFTNYFLGMIVAIMINKKGIRIKKFWRGVLVLTIAVPQFISLLYISNLFSATGIINKFLQDFGLIELAIDFWNEKWISRVLVIVINIWVGIPHIMLIATGILMNIPADLYESARIDGANSMQQYMKITLPYMLFVTGPYLLTSFVSNINNFNVIYLLTYAKNYDPELGSPAGGATNTDLLVTWLYRITQGGDNKYQLSAVIGLLIFIVVALISLIVYNVMPSTRNEEDYS